MCFGAALPAWKKYYIIFWKSSNLSYYLVYMKNRFINFIHISLKAVWFYTSKFVDPVLLFLLRCNDEPAKKEIFFWNFFFLVKSMFVLICLQITQRCRGRTWAWTHNHVVVIWGWTRVIFFGWRWHGGCKLIIKGLIINFNIFVLYFKNGQNQREYSKYTC